MPRPAPISSAESCAHGGECVLGEVVDGGMRLSQFGQVVSHWARIRITSPTWHWASGWFCPNHVHGIIVITGRGEAFPARASFGGKPDNWGNALAKSKRLQGMPRPYSNRPCKLARWAPSSATEIGNNPAFNRLRGARRYPLLAAQLGTYRPQRRVPEPDPGIYTGQPRSLGRR